MVGRVYFAAILIVELLSFQYCCGQQGTGCGGGKFDINPDRSTWATNYSGEFYEISACSLTLIPGLRLQINLGNTSSYIYGVISYSISESSCDVTRDSLPQFTTACSVVENCYYFSLSLKTVLSRDMDSLILNVIYDGSCLKQTLVVQDCNNLNDGVIVDPSTQCGYNCTAQFSCNFENGFEGDSLTSTCGADAQFRDSFSCRYVVCSISTIVTANTQPNVTNNTVEFGQVVGLTCKLDDGGTGAAYVCGIGGIFELITNATNCTDPFTTNTTSPTTTNSTDNSSTATTSDYHPQPGPFRKNCTCSDTAIGLDVTFFVFAFLLKGTAVYMHTKGKVAISAGSFTLGMAFSTVACPILTSFECTAVTCFVQWGIVLIAAFAMNTSFGVVIGYIHITERGDQDSSKRKRTSEEMREKDQEKRQ